MKIKLFTVYDSKIGLYKEPFTRRTTGEALRGWQEVVNDNTDGNMLCKHAEDFTLFEVGEWDDETGAYTEYQAKKSLGTGVEYKKQ